MRKKKMVVIRLTEEDTLKFKMYCIQKGTTMQGVLEEYIKSLLAKK